MSVEREFTKENLNLYLKELAKEFRKRNGKTMRADFVSGAVVGFLFEMDFVMLPRT